MSHVTGPVTRDANKFKISTTADTVTTATQTHLKLPGEPSKLPLGTSMTTSAIKIGESPFFFWPSAGPPPLQPLVWNPCSATPLQKWCFHVIPTLFGRANF